MNNRKGLLVRVGIDQTFGQYNAPLNPVTNDYMYLPIPEGESEFNSGMQTSYRDIVPFLKSWSHTNNVDIRLPDNLLDKNTHLDPDFYFSTYGDQATGRGARISELVKDDFIVFFASFKPISKCEHKLVYAIYGIMVIDRVVTVSDISDEMLGSNAHTRIKKRNKSHLVVFSNPNLSGRFNKAIPIGEFRRKAYRVTNSILEEWGGLDVKDGFIQRSVCPPWFTEPNKFIDWLSCKNVKLINNNWE